MALRVMQIFIPRTGSQPLSELLGDVEVLGKWTDDDANRNVLYILVPAEAAEPVMDRLSESYEDCSEFRIVLYPVEAVLPRDAVEEEFELDQSQAGSDQQEEQPPPERVSREELYTHITTELGLTRVFVCLSALSAVVATVGLLRDDVSVIIGAMVIAPLLAPNVAMSLATTLGDMDLLKRAVTTNLTGLLTSFSIAVVTGLTLGCDPQIPAIANRSEIGFPDIVLALASGAAGTLAFTKGLSNALIGVMVAVALMPPLVVSGMLFGAGNLEASGRAAMLTVANVVCINLAGVVTFLAQGVRPRSWWEAERAAGAVRRAVTIWLVLLAALALVILANRYQGSVS